MWRRLTVSVLESVEMKTQLEQIAQTAEDVHNLCVFDRGWMAASVPFAPVGPGGWNERATAVGQHDQHEQHAAPAHAVDHINRLPLEGVAPAGDGDLSWMIVAMGSLRPLPSTR